MELSKEYSAALESFSNYPLMKKAFLSPSFILGSACGALSSLFNSSSKSIVQPEASENKSLDYLETAHASIPFSSVPVSIASVFMPAGSTASILTSVWAPAALLSDMLQNREGIKFCAFKSGFDLMNI